MERTLKQLQNSLKFATGIAFTVLARFIPHPPNFEPILATTMPFAKRFGKTAGFLFAFATLAAIDLISGKLGLWTIYTAVTYGVVGWLAAVYLQRVSRVGRRHFVGFAVFGTLFYDAVTAFFFGLEFHQTLAQTVVGQIPFTLTHLLGSVTLAALVSPLLYKHFVANENVFAFHALEENKKPALVLKRA